MLNKEISITTSIKGNATVIKIHGDVTKATSPTIAEKGLQSPGVATAKTIILSFSKDCYINSGGLEFLIGVASHCKQNGQKICATGLSDHFQKIFHMIGLSKYVEIFPSEEEALSN